MKRNKFLSMQIYTDANYAGSADDRRSATRYGCFVGGNLMS